MTRIIINSHKHGFGDAALTACMVEGGKKQGLEIVHYAFGEMANLVRTFGQVAVEDVGKSDIVNFDMPYTEELRQAGRLSALHHRAEFVGVKEIDFPKPHVSREASEWSLLAEKEAGGDIVLMFPECRNEQFRAWPVPYWIDLACMLSKWGYVPVFCLWNLDRPFTLTEFRCYKCLDWDYTVALMLRSRFVIGNDSGPSYVSGIFRITTFVLCGMSTKECLGGIDRMIHIAVDSEVSECVGCFRAGMFRFYCHSGCRALMLLTPETVMDRIAKWILNSFV
jgi:ADP-heptose:LPS heptosyltransferase